MTEELKACFTRWNAPGGEWRLEVRGYLLHPKKLDTAARIADYDKSAARTIAECEEIIKLLNEYRQELQRRYAQLETMSYKDTLTLKRDPSRYGGITYYVTITRTFEDGTTQDIQSEHYEGKQRREAIKRFAELRKAHPGIDAVEDIAKKYWEK